MGVCVCVCVCVCVSECEREGERERARGGGAAGECDEVRGEEGEPIISQAAPALPRTCSVAKATVEPPFLRA